MREKKILELQDVVFPNDEVPRTEVLHPGEWWNWKWLDSPSHCEQVADALQGLLPPVSGKILFLDKEPSENRNRVGRVFCGTPFVSNLTIAENIRLPVLFENDAEARRSLEKRVTEILEACGETELSAERPDRLSDPDRCYWQWVRALSRPRDLYVFEGDAHILLSNKYLHVMEEFLKCEMDRGAAVVTLTFRERKRG